MNPWSSSWFSPACLAATACRNQFFWLYQSDRSDCNRRLFVSAHNEYKCFLKEPKLLFTDIMKILGYWWPWKSVLNNSKSWISLLFNQFVVLTSTADKVECFARKFSWLIWSTYTWFPPRMEALLSDMYITLSLLSNIISKLDFHKARRCDRIPAVILKQCASKLSPVFSNFYTPLLFRV